MKNRKIVITLLLSLLLVILSACNSTSNAAESDAAILEEATAWFEEQTSHYEIICGEAHGDSVVFLTGTKNPGTDSYQLLQAFVIKKNDEGFAVAAMKDGERAISAGIAAYVLEANDLTIVFGDTGDSVFDFINDRRLEANFTSVNVLYENGEAAAKEITGNAPYLLVFTDAVEIADIEFVSPELTVKYSSFFGDVLMNDTASYDVSNIFG